MFSFFPKLRTTLMIATLFLVPASVVGQEDSNQVAPREARPGIHDFDEIKVEHLRPEDLPQEGPFLPPAIVDSSVDDLPRVLSVGSLRTTRDKVAERTFELIVLVQPGQPYRQTPMIFRGHALWLSAKDDLSSPVLVSTHDWLEDGKAFFLVPPEMKPPSDPRGSGNTGQQAEFRTLESVTSGGLDFQWIESHRHQLVELEIERGDRHRNLTALRPKKGSSLKSPSQGLEIFNARGQLPPQIFGFSPFISEELVPALFLRDDPSHESLAFYMQTNFPGILGAPIVSPHGHVIGLGAVRNPHNESVTLSIPPTSIEAFVRGVQSDRSDKD